VKKLRVPTVPWLSSDTVYVSYGFIPVPAKVKVFAGMVMVMEKCTHGIPVNNPKENRVEDVCVCDCNLG
jgi:hypothetical protein